MRVNATRVLGMTPITFKPFVKKKRRCREKCTFFFSRKLGATDFDTRMINAKAEPVHGLVFGMQIVNVDSNLMEKTLQKRKRGKSTDLHPVFDVP